MTRREFARNTLGALFGVSVIPAFGQKPVSKMVMGIDSSAGRDYYTIVKGFWHPDGRIEWKETINIPIPPPADISEATKIHLKEMWG